MYVVERNPKYDFADESYKSVYPNLHKYPATMLPQVGIEILKEYNIKTGVMLDPYCGSGSSFASGLEFNFTDMYGFDLNPLATLINLAKFTKFNPDTLAKNLTFLKSKIYDSAKNNFANVEYIIPSCKNIDFWFSPLIQVKLAVINYFINKLKNDNLIFKVAFSETIRDCSYTRNNEFKLYRIKEEDIMNFNPDVFGMFFSKCERNIRFYNEKYLPNLSQIKFHINNSTFDSNKINGNVDVVLTSPPYGDSKTTVAYGQFSNFSNEWLGYKDARSIDKELMGGKNKNKLYESGCISDFIYNISKVCMKRALEVSSFYYDLEKSIDDVSRVVKLGGYSIYVVGNRTVKKINLPTDQFVAEKFESNGFKHISTYKRILSNKLMPRRNSPSNKIGDTMSTMNFEYIVVSRRVS